MSIKTIITCDICGADNSIATHLEFLRKVEVSWKHNLMATPETRSVMDMCSNCFRILVDGIEEATNKDV